MRATALATREDNPDDLQQRPPGRGAADPVLPVSHPSGSAWYVVYTHQNRERRAVMELEDLGYEVYLPCRTVWVRHARRREKKQRPLFPRYLFVSLDINRDSFMAVQEADGVSYLLKQNDIPLQIPTDLVELIQHKEEVGSYDETTGNLDGIEEGDAVRLVDAGPFDDELAVFEKADDKRSVEVLLSILGRQTRLKVDVAQIRKI